MLVQLLVFLGVLSLSFADKQWVLDTSAGATFVSGVGARSTVSAVAATGVNGVGSVVNIYDGSSWASQKVQSGMLLDGAMTADGTTVITGIYSTLISTDGGLTYTTAAGAKGTSQSANVYGENRDKIALVGMWSSDHNFPASVATSSDNGQTFTISSAVPDGSVRYGAFPSDNTWFVSSGMWGNDPAKSAEGLFEISSRVTMDGFKNTNKYNVFNEPVRKPQLADNSTTGWFGSVSKTVDGGKSWTQVLTTNVEQDYIYFNAITCSSELNCMVVGEGDDVNGGYRTVVYATFDGGNNWELTFDSKDLVSLMGAKFVSATEGWILGTSKHGRSLTGQFYKTTDGGKTFTLFQSLTDCMAMDLDLVGDAGYASCCNSAGTVCFPTIYK